jgi:serine/threonine-protein kinase
VVLRSPIASYGEYAVSDNGVLLLAKRMTGAGSSSITYINERGDSSKIVLPIEAAVYDGARFSPDGRRVAVGAASRRSMSRSVYMWDLARGVAQRLTSEDDVRRPVWNVAGDSIVYRLGRQRFVARAADGSGEPRTVLALTGWVATEGLSVNGPWIAFAGEPIGNATSTDIATAHRDSGGLARPYANSNSTENEPAISPDGHWMAYTSNETGRPEVYVSAFPVPGARYPVSTSGGRSAVWGADSRRIFYATVSGVYQSVSFTPGSPPTFGAPRFLYERDLSRDWTISSDGKQLLFVDTARLTPLLGLELVLNAYAARR